MDVPQFVQLGTAIVRTDQIIRVQMVEDKSYGWATVYIPDQGCEFISITAKQFVYLAKLLLPTEQ